MPTPLSLNDPFTLFLFVAATLMMLGYGIGRWTNQRRARRIRDWLEPGLRSLGGAPLVQRVSRSAFRLQVLNARSPFQTVTVSVVLISREVLPTWLWERWRGHRDLLVVHVTFRLTSAEKPLSLETSAREETQSPLGDFVEDKKIVSPEEAYVNHCLQEHTKEALATLIAFEEKLLMMRFGIGGTTEKTLEEIGKDFSVTRERIRQIESKALQKLRHHYQYKKLRTFIEC